MCLGQYQYLHWWLQLASVVSSPTQMFTHSKTEIIYDWKVGTCFKIKLQHFQLHISFPFPETFNGKFTYKSWRTLLQDSIVYNNKNLPCSYSSNAFFICFSNISRLDIANVLLSSCTLVNMYTWWCMDDHAPSQVVDYHSFFFVKQTQ